MKAICTLLVLVFAQLALAGETSTDCPAMRESCNRSNPKNVDSMNTAKTIKAPKSTSKQ